MSLTPTPRIDIPIYERTLANGLRVIVSPDANTPVAAVNLWYDVGSKDEAPGQAGWAHLFEHLMFQGSANVTSGEHIQVMQEVGGVVNASTWFDRTNYFETVPTGALDLALWLEADRLATLPQNITATNVATQRDVVKEEKRQNYDNVPYGDTVERIVELAFPADHPYGHTTIGKMTDLDAATPQAAADFFRTHYRTDNAVLTIITEVSVADAFERVERYFGWIPKTAGSTRIVPAPLPPITGIPHAELTADVPQDAIHFVWRLPVLHTPEYDAANMAFNVLCQGQASRFYQDLIRNLGVATNVSAGTLGLIGGNSLGIASAYVTPGVAPETVETLMVEHFDRLADNGPSANELARAFAQYQREWLTELAEPSSRANALSSFATLHGDPGLINSRLAEVARVSAEDIRHACQTVLAPTSRAVLTYRTTRQSPAITDSTEVRINDSTEGRADA